MQKRSSILIVDDTETNVDILVELLSDSYEIVVALDGKSALEILEEQEVDLILLDIMMPIIDGYDVCRRVKQNEKTNDIPIIFITAKTDEESIEKAYEAGGMDYVTKPFKPKELFARIKTQLQLRALIQELESSKNALKHLSETDPMTKLWNRRYFGYASKNILELAKRDKTALTVVMLDIDKFKEVNDTYGHNVGDDIIISLANILLEMTRKSDLACRFGGEEFILLLPETSLEGAMVIAEKIRKKVESFSLHLEDEREVNVTVSLGVSQVDTENDLSIESAIKRADIALYKAKEKGRDKVCVEK
jgi:diguanylate cyclase (GGDEF)-like protein